MPVVQELLSDLGTAEATAALNTPNKYKETPLHHACKGGHTPLVAEFLKKYADVDVNARDIDGNTPLNFMLEGRQLHELPTRDISGTVKLLLSHSAVDVNTSDFEGNTPLHKVSTDHEVALVSISHLVSRGCDVNAVNAYGKMPHQEAINRGASAYVVRTILEDPRLDKQVLVDTIVKLLLARYNFDFNHGMHYSV